MRDIESSVISLLQESSDRLKEIFSFDSVPDIGLDIPREVAFGDLSSNIALQVGRHIRHPGKEIAHIMVDHMNGRIKEAPYADLIDRIEVKGPGFINFFLKKDSLYFVIDLIEKEGKAFGRNDLGKGKKLNLEFVSANPTGPLTIAHGRQAAFGDSLANILKFSGYAVTREYYINDEGRQINLLGASIRARYLDLLGEEAVFPEDGYKGDYIADIAKEIIDKYKAKKVDAPQEFFGDFGYKLLMRGIKEDLTAFGVEFDTWFSQRSLSARDEIAGALALLRERGHVYDSEGAVWLRSTAFGDEKDRVIVKSDGSYTYFGPDIAYHMDKYKRGYDVLIDTWGPDHHGYIPRMKAAVEGLGYDKDSLNTLIIQLVTLYRGDAPVRMSTRAGSFVTLKEVIEEIGRDVARFFFIRRKRDSHLDFDLELAKKQSMDNPVYYIQYAHARISSIIDYEDKERKMPKKGAKVDLTLLKSDEEFKVLRTLKAFPMAVRSSAEVFEPYRLLSYMEDLAKSFHSFYNKHRVVSEDEALTAARLLMVECVKIVIANGLGLLGVSAPTQM